MALKNIPVKENYDCTKIIENGQMVMLNNSLMIYSPSNAHGCPLVLNFCKDMFTQNLKELVLDPKYFHFAHQDTNCKNVYDLTKMVDLTTKNDISESLALLDICGGTEVDRTELNDISKLSEITYTSKESTRKNNDLQLSDDDEVVFVNEYKENENTDIEKATKQVDKKTDNKRRNPVRNVRNKSRNLSKELLFEEDFAFLDTTDDEFEEQENKTDVTPPVIQLPKEWPINVHERPEYNAVTQTIESFDYTIREIQKKAVMVKKTRTEAVTIRKNTRKKPEVRRRRKPTIVTMSETVSLDKLKPLINSTTDMLKEYFINNKKYRDIIPSNSTLCSFENKLEILKNQAFLFAIVNNLDEKEVGDKFKHLNLDNDAKKYYV